MLILPVIDLEKVVETKIHFEDFPEDYSIVTNHHINKREYTVVGTIRNLSRSIMSGGKFDIETKYIKDKPVHIALNGKWSMFNNSELKKNLYKIIDEQRTFLNDNDFPHFALIIYDGGASKNIAGVSGSFFENVLTMLVIDSEQKNKPLLYGLFSHELFHAWIGNKVRIPEPQGDLQWFFEGVNDFYAWQLAFDAGLLSNKQYIKYYNRVIKEYSLSPYKTESNEVLSKDFNLRNPAGRLAMLRGHIVFMEIFNKLKSQKKGREPLDMALREIIEKYSHNNSYITRDNLDQIFRNHLGDQIWSDALKILYDGEPVSFSPTLFSNNILLKNIAIAAPDFGFNVKLLVKEKRIASLAKNSNASLAGLKENDKVLDCGFDITSASTPIQVGIEESGKRKTIQFMPQKTKKIIPQYKHI